MNKKLKQRPENIDPDITRNFANFIKEKSEIGQYRVEVKIGGKIIPIDVFPTVFPPRSDYSASSKSVFQAFENLGNLEVADIGSGSGIESIAAAMAGARHVDAADNNPNAVSCSKHNVEMNGLQEKIEVFYSDLFQNFPKKKYDLIIANLPIVNFEADNNLVNNALYDGGLKMHKRLFMQAKSFMAEGGELTLTHSNLQSGRTSNQDYDFQVLEKLIGESGYKIDEKITTNDLGYKWINYKITIR